MIIQWILKHILKNISRAKGFADPFRVIGQLQAFSQPSEVAAPVELLRLSSVLQVRGLLNAQAIQHNLDWIWPYWVQKQFNPRDKAFVPRAFSMTHINLTHRNWTAIGLPEVREIPIVDPAGALTPHYDGWSIDCWLYERSGIVLAPSREDDVCQNLSWDHGLSVATSREKDGRRLKVTSWVDYADGVPHAFLEAEGLSPENAELVISLRPMNPEGVSFINHIKWLPDQKAWLVNKKQKVQAFTQPDKILFSHYRQGDVFSKLSEDTEQNKVKCPIGMATSAWVYKIKPGQLTSVQISVPLKEESFAPEDVSLKQAAEKIWKENLSGLCEVKCPDRQFQFLYDAALRSVLLHAPGDEVYPGPYTYKHFWFRDAAFILEAMLSLGLTDKAEQIIDSFPSRQTPFGHFLSQDGEWDSNGEALWMIERFCSLTNRKPKENWLKCARKGSDWLMKKRLPEDSEEIHAGLLPAGFSAEHLGPNDYYYWDDFWGVKGLLSAAKIFERAGDKEQAQKIRSEAESFSRCIDKSLAAAREHIGSSAMPSSPHRRLDTGSIGSIAAGYPLQLWQSQDERLLATIEYLLENCMVKDGFFHDMSHSGINPYLTLEMAQVLLRAGDARYFKLMSAIARLASPTGQWPEAVHPLTDGGCMGDGQHVWAAAEWLLMIRNCFVLEEEDKLILGAGLPPEWLKKGEDMLCGPVLTKFGSIKVFVKFQNGMPRLTWEGQWFSAEPQIEIKLPEFV